MAEKVKRSPFPPTFYVANVMEIFERMAWYGFFAVSSLYMTSPVSEGGLGFSSIERGKLQGIIPFLLYLFPVITGALADRFGYKRTFIVAFSIMTPAYFLLGQFHSYWAFFGAFLLVAVGAATFKPVVVGTVGRTTDDTNRGIGFGVFYTIVNVGGFIGPIVAGYVRAISWDLVFVMSMVWIAINFIPTLFFYKEPTTESTSESKRSVMKVLHDAQSVLGNGRFALIVVPILVLMMVADNQTWFTWARVLMISGGWIVLNLLWNMVASKDEDAPWYAQKAKIGNWAFVTYLLILAGFWASFQQIFITMPEYIRDFVETRDLVEFASIFGQGFVNFMASVNVENLANEIGNQFTAHANIGDSGLASTLFYELVHFKVRVPIEEIQATWQQIASTGGLPGNDTMALVAQEWAARFDVSQDAVTATVTQLMNLDGYQNWSQAVVQTEGISVRSVMENGFAPLFAMGTPDQAAILATTQELATSLGVPQSDIIITMQQISANMPYAMQWAADYRQVNPEYIINIDAGSIVLFQILVSTVIDRWKPFPVLVVGTIVAGTGIALGSLAITGFLVVMAIVVFAFGEMIASPKSQEYVARIAPKDKVALFMGYYFVSVALGNLFGGLLSGEGYQVMAKDMNNPELMWIVFGAIGFLTAIALLVFNKLVVPKLEAQREANHE